jgi:hypothetical protein
MPKFTFVCSKCSHSSQQVINDLSITALPCSNCGSPADRKLPNLSGKSQVNETVDSHMGVKWQEDHEKTLTDRKRTYFWSVEVPRMVNSGVYSIETMLENRWVYYDEKGQLITRTKPPEAQ